jgi:hypothetical protein
LTRLANSFIIEIKEEIPTGDLEGSLIYMLYLRLIYFKISSSSSSSSSNSFLEGTLILKS